MSIYEQSPSVDHSLQMVKEMLKSGDSTTFFDIDGVLKGKKTADTPNGFDPALPGLMSELSAYTHGKIGAMTSQSPIEFEEFAKTIEGDTIDSVFTGPSVFEDGHIWTPKNVTPEVGYISLTSPEACYETETLKKILRVFWQPESAIDSNGWGFFPNVATPVRIPVGDAQGIVTGTIWEKGPDMSDPSYEGQYTAVHEFVDRFIHFQRFTHITWKEVGNGTVRILEIGRTKATAMQGLSEHGIIDLQKSIFFCDGSNDIEAARLIAESGGAVIALANSEPEIKSVATVISSLPESHGVCDVLSKLLHTV
jgi:haloacid dehalogenase-like hydrolase